MIERLAVVFILFVVGFAAYSIFNRRQIKRIASLESTQDAILRRLQPGIPAVVYFTTPDCVPCRTQQMPALKRLSENLGENNIQIIQVDATQEIAAADRWGVFSAPTTFILDETGKTTAVNYGFADVPKLKQQLKVS